MRRVTPSGEARQIVRVGAYVGTLALYFVSSLLHPAAAQSLRWLGNRSATDLSADGSVVVGTAECAYRWVLSGSPQILTGCSGTMEYYADGVSPNGNIVVGSHVDARYDDYAYYAFRWIPSTNDLQILPYFAGSPVEDVLYGAYDVSETGVVVGYGQSSRSGPIRACYWNAQNQIFSLHNTESRATGVSMDGNVIVGWLTDSGGQRRAFRWQGGSSQTLGTLGGTWSWANDVSPEGLVVVGASYDQVGLTRAFRWPNGAMQNLGTLGGNSEAYAASAYGLVVVGSAYDQNGQKRAFRWTQQSGIQDLNVVYAQVVGDSRLITANAISPDGRYIVGMGYNASTGRNESYILDTAAPSPCPSDVDRSGMVDDADLLQVLFSFGSACGGN